MVLSGCGAGVLLTRTCPLTRKSTPRTAAVQTLMSEFELEWVGLSHTRLAAAGFGNILDGVRACATLRVLKADAATIFVRSIPLIIEVIEDRLGMQGWKWCWGEFRPP